MTKIDKSAEALRDTALDLERYHGIKADITWSSDTLEVPEEGDMYTDSSSKIYIGDTAKEWNKIGDGEEGYPYGTTSPNHTIMPNTAGNQCPQLPYFVGPFGISTGPNMTIGSNDKHCVFRLPESSMPNMVYISGRLVTVGIIGSDVQAAYAGGNKLIFAPGELDIIKYNNKITVSVDYGDSLYHYNIELTEWGMVMFEDDSTVIKAKMVSKVIKR